MRSGEVLRQEKEDFLKLPEIIKEVDQPVIVQDQLI